MLFWVTTCSNAQIPLKYIGIDRNCGGNRMEGSLGWSHLLNKRVRGYRISSVFLPPAESPNNFSVEQQLESSSNRTTRPPPFSIEATCVRVTIPLFTAVYRTQRRSLEIHQQYFDW